MSTEAAWITLGVVGQLLFTGRFLVQWILSERSRRSVLPAAFWYLSIGGAVILLTYAIHKQDPVFMMGQSAGLLVYVRNLQLMGKTPAAATGSAQPN